MVHPQLPSSGRQHGMSGAAHESVAHGALHMSGVAVEPPVLGAPPVLMPARPPLPVLPALALPDMPAELAVPDAPPTRARPDVPAALLVPDAPPKPAFEPLPERPPVPAARPEPTAERSTGPPGMPPLAAAVAAASCPFGPIVPASSAPRVGVSVEGAQSWQTENTVRPGVRGSMPQTRTPAVPVWVQMHTEMSPTPLQCSSVRASASDPLVAPTGSPSWSELGAASGPTSLPAPR